MKRVNEYEYIVEGPMYPDYWQGQGLAYTPYTNMATGIGHTLNEALDDALEMLAQNDNDWDLKDLEQRIRQDNPDDKWDLSIDDAYPDEDMSESYLYVTIKVN